MMLRSFSRRKGSADTVMLLSLHSSSLEGSPSPAAVASTAAGPQQQASRVQSPAKAILSPGAFLPAPRRWGRKREGRERAGARGGAGAAGEGMCGGRALVPRTRCRLRCAGSGADAWPARPRSLFLPAAYLGKGKGRGLEEGDMGRKDEERKEEGNRGF